MELKITEAHYPHQLGHLTVLFLGPVSLNVLLKLCEAKVLP
jgi:hypothetical protein